MSELDKMTAHSTLKELGNFKFYGIAYRVNEFMDMLCFSVPLQEVDLQKEKIYRTLHIIKDQNVN